MIGPGRCLMPLVLAWCFLALFLGTDERPHHVYKARSYRRSGRWICLGTPAAGAMVSSDIDLTPVFRRQFALTAVPAVSGVALSVDTSDLPGQGTAVAVIRRIRFLENKK